MRPACIDSHRKMFRNSFEKGWKEAGSPGAAAANAAATTGWTAGTAPPSWWKNATEDLRQDHPPGKYVVKNKLAV